MFLAVVRVLVAGAVAEAFRAGVAAVAQMFGHGTGYQYAHDGPEHFVAQEYLGVDKTFYEPTEQGVEKKIKERLANWRKQFAETKKQK